MRSHRSPQPPGSSPRRLVVRRKRLFKIRPRQLLVALAVLTVTGYFGGALLLANWYSKNKYNRITYADIVLPHRWDGLGTLRGQAMVDHGMDEIRAQRVAAGFPLLRIGLTRAPDNPEARLMLAQIYTLLRLLPKASDTLIAGLRTPAPDIDYYRDSLKILGQMDDPGAILDFTTKAVPLTSPDTPAGRRERALLEKSAVNALVQLKRFDEALAGAQALSPPDAALVNELKIEQRFLAGDAVAAAQIAGDWAAAEPKSERALVNAIRTHARAGRIKPMQAAARQLRELNPINPTFASFEIIENRAAAEHAAADAALDRYLAYYGATPASINSLAQHLAKRGFTPDIQRLETHAIEHGFDTGSIRVALIKSHRLNLQWASMSQQVDLLLSERVASRPRVSEWAATMKLLATVCSGDSSGSQNQLASATLDHGSNMELYEAVLEALYAAGRYEEAAQIADLASGRFPRSIYLAGFQTKVADELTRKQALLASQNQPDEQPAQELTLEELRTRLAALRTDGKHADAISLLRHTRMRTPGILSGSEHWAARQELDLAGESNDLAHLQLYLKTHLKNRAVSTAETLSLAKTWKTRGQDFAALLTVREVLRTAPDDAEALQLLAQWTPRPAEEPATPAEDGETAHDNDDKT